MEIFNTDNLKNEYGLSCIENYILYLLAQNNNSWQQIFYESILPFNNIMRLMIEGQTYSFFTGVPRLHRTCEKLGLLELSFYTDNNFPAKLVKNKVFLMQVSGEFMKKKFSMSPWRKDHYILFRYIGNDVFEYMNDIPPSVGRLTSMEIQRIYEKNIIMINILENVHCDYKALVKKFKEKLLSANDIQNYNEEDITFEKLRDAIGISKVLVKRAEAFINMIGVPFFTNYYSFMCNYYIKAEYMRARRYNDCEALKMLKEVEKEERHFKQNMLDAVYKYF